MHVPPNVATNLFMLAVGLSSSAGSGYPEIDQSGTDLLGVRTVACVRLIHSCEGAGLAPNSSQD